MPFEKLHYYISICVDMFPLINKRKGVIYMKYFRKLVSAILLLYVCINSISSLTAFASTEFTGLGLIAEIENCITDTALWQKKGGTTASGRYFVEAKVTNTTGQTTVGAKYDFTLTEDKTVYIWIRARATGGGDDSAYISVDEGNFDSVFFEASSDYSYIWHLYKKDLKLKAGSHSISLSPREKGLRLDQMVITSSQFFTPEGICTEIKNTVGTISGKWPVPQVTPPKGQHPRVYFTEDKKASIISNLDAPENSEAKSRFESYALETLTTVPAYSTTTLARIECKALYSCLYDDEKTRNEAISAIELIAQMRPGTDDSLAWRKYGEMIHVLAEIYDWCYKGLTEEQKERILMICVQYASNMEMGWPPSKQTAVNGHGSEFQLLRDLMSLSIATYDERPDLWNYIGGRFYAEYVPIREFRLKGHYNMQGTNYGYYRTEADAYAYALITGMGAPEPYSGENLAGVGYSEIYLKRPDGRYLNDGDMYESNVLPATYRTNEKDGMLIESYAASDGVLKGEYFRRSMDLSGGAIKQTFADGSPVMQIIFSRPEVKVKSIHTLPKSKYYETPVGMITARTGWEEGRNSDTVLAMMKIGEYHYSNHQHQDSGTFQIYYKGLLAGKGGKYDLYDTEEHSMYTTKTISHNGLLIYDPSEDKGIVSRTNVNDGGQLFENILTEPIKRAEVTAHEIDPENSVNPEYSYIKGDITDAYSDKVSKVSRSMMFVNLGLEDMPGVFITFDNIVSKDATFKKTWVLHGTQEPATDGNRSVFTAKPSKKGDECGVMTVDTLLPKADNLQKEVYGSSQEGFGIVNSWKYNTTKKKWEITKSKNYVPGADEANEIYTRRMEISPKTANLEDKFLNVMFIGDNESSEKALLAETSTHYGATFYDKAVFFGKTSSLNTTFNVSSNEKYDYIICDMAEGTYNVVSDLGTQTVCASKEGGVLSFTCEGNVSVTKVSDEYTAPQDNSHQLEERIYYKTEEGFGTSLPGGNLAAAEEFLNAVGFELTNNGSKYSIYSGEELIAEFTPGDTKAFTPRGLYEFTKVPQEENGILMMSPLDMLTLTIDTDTYLEYANILFPGDKYLPMGPYVKGNVYEKDGKNVLSLSAVAHKPYEGNLVAALYQDDEYKGCISLNKANSYTGAITFDKGTTPRLEWYFWADNLMPIGVDVDTRFIEKSKIESLYTLYGNSSGKLNPVSSTSGNSYKYNITNDGNMVTATKTVADSDAGLVIDIGTDPYVIGEEADHGYMHYSVVYEATDIANALETFRIRVRGHVGDFNTYYDFTLPKDNGCAYKIDVIVELENAKMHYYVNGELQKSYDISFWSAVRRLEHYIFTSSGITGTTFKLISPTIAVYPKTANLDDIINNTIYNETNTIWE